MTKRLHHDKPQLRNWQARAAAKTAGLKQYWTGFPCAHGHIDWRLTSNGMCMECARIKASAYAKTEAGIATARKAKLKAQAAGKSAAASADWRRRNPDKNKAAAQRWRDNYLNDYVRTRKAIDLNFRISRSLRSRLSAAIRYERNKWRLNFSQKWVSRSRSRLQHPRTHPLY